MTYLHASYVCVEKIFEEMGSNSNGSVSDEAMVNFLISEIFILKTELENIHIITF